ncbi:MAG: hypothetical protein WKF84_05500 [Pyrinomonadaceae bacterium]
MNLPPEVVRAAQPQLCCGVPYVIPKNDARQIAEAWLGAIDAFWPRRWEDQMYAFGLATIKLRLNVALTRAVDHNFWHDAGIMSDCIHYCYGDHEWSKRHYGTSTEVKHIWNPSVSSPRGTILGEIIGQINEARQFYAQIW